MKTRAIGECDLLVVPGGGARERVISAVELLDDGACRRILFTDGLAPALAAPRDGRFHGLDPGRVVRAPFISESTWGDALTALAAAREHGFRHLLVVTSPYHTRRVEWFFARVLEGTGIRFGVHPSDSFYMKEQSWWRSRYGRQSVAGEYLKLWAAGMASEAVVAGAAAAALPAGSF